MIDLIKRQDDMQDDATLILADVTGINGDAMRGTELAALASGVDVTSIHGSALTETVGGYLAAGFTKLFDVATPVLVASDVMRGTNSVPTNPLLTNDARLDNLDATISSRNATTPLNAAAVKAEAVAALSDINLDHLVKIAVDTDWPTTVHLDSVLGHLADVGTAATFNRTTDALEAIRNVAPHGSTMVGTDAAALANVCTETRLAELTPVEVIENIFDYDMGYWTEVDVPGRVVIDYSDERIEITDLDDDEDVYVYKATDANVTDFILDFEFQVLGTSVAGSAMGIGLADGIGTMEDVTNGLYVRVYFAASNVNMATITHMSSGSASSSAHIVNLLDNTTYYGRLVRRGSYCLLNIYSDRIRETHMSGSPVEYNDATPVAFTHLYPVSAYNNGTADKSMDAYLEAIKFVSAEDIDKYLGMDETGTSTVLSGIDTNVATIAIDVAGLNGEAMRGTDSAALAATALSDVTWTDAKAVHLDANISSRNATTPPTVGAIRTEMEGVGTKLTAVKDKTDNLPSGMAKNVAVPKFDFLMVLSSNHVTGATGKTVTGTISKDGGAFAAIANTITEVSGGVYTIADGFTQTEMNVDVATLMFAADDCDTRVITIITS